MPVQATPGFPPFGGGEGQGMGLATQLPPAAELVELLRADDFPLAGDLGVTSNEDISNEDVSNGSGPVASAEGANGSGPVASAEGIANGSDPWPSLKASVGSQLDHARWKRRVGDHWWRRGTDGSDRVGSACNVWTTTCAGEHRECARQRQDGQRLAQRSAMETAALVSGSARGRQRYATLAVESDVNPTAAAVERRGCKVSRHGWTQRPCGSAVAQWSHRGREEAADRAVETSASIERGRLGAKGKKERMEAELMRRPL